MDRQRAESLIDGFQGQIIGDCHSLEARYARSEAAREILESPVDMLPFIAAHLAGYVRSTDFPLVESKVRIAWCWLLTQIFEENEVGEPPTVNTFESWVEWAKGFRPAADSAAT